MADTMTALVERHRAFLVAYASADFEMGGYEAEKAFLATADTEAVEILCKNPPPVRDHSDLMAALEHVAGDSDFISEGHARILRQTIDYLRGRTFDRDGVAR